MTEAPTQAITVISQAVSTILANDKDDLLGKLAAEIAEFEPDAAREAAAIAIAQERQRAAIAATEAEAKRREANKSHQRRIHNDMLEDLMPIVGWLPVDGKVVEDACRAVITALATGKIRHVKVEY